MLASLFVPVLALTAPLVAFAAPVSPASSLEERAVYKYCADVSVCGDSKIVENSHHYCHKNVCDWACNDGYYRKDNKCWWSGSSSSSTSSGSTSSSSSSTTEFVSTNNNVLAASGVTKFTGTNTGAIASWFRTNSAQDSTNGNSWCWFPYNDNTPGIAISLNTMMSDANWDATAARQKYCGLEVVVTTPSGHSETLYVTDAFDDAWVRTPTSIDVVFNAFQKLWGGYTDNKNDVIQNVQWKFTGRRSEQYKYAGAGN